MKWKWNEIIIEWKQNNRVDESEKIKIENEIHTKITLQNQRTKEPKIEAKKETKSRWVKQKRQNED